jgi:hypothetical protein
VEVVYNWQRMTNEPLDWFGRFNKYARPLGTEYTIQKAFTLFRLEMIRQRLDTEDEGGVIQIWASVAKEWFWEGRAKQWADDDRLDSQIKWQVRKQELLEEDWFLGGKLRKVVARALDDFETKVEVLTQANGDKLVKLSVPLSHLAQASRAGSELQRLAANAPTSITEIRAPQIYLPAVEGIKDEAPADH